jgi:hypothetical protein
MSTTCAAMLLTATLALGGPATDPGGPAELVRMSRADLESLYRSAEVGVIPLGSTRGRAIYRPGTRVTVPASWAVHVLWRGKVFREDGTMVNRTFAGRAVTARVYIGESWLDGRPTLVLDYADTSKLFRDVRDEQREIAPGLYLGLTYVRGQPDPVFFYTIDARR